MRQIKKTKEPADLFINGTLTGGVQNAQGYRSLLDQKERSETIAVLRLRLASLDLKKRRTADEFFTEFFAENSLPIEG
jgi:hypothetical protein